MEYKKTIQYYEEDISRCNTKEEFIIFLGLLAEDFLQALNTQKEYGCEWENISIDSYLNAIQAWCQAVNYMNAGDPFIKDQKYIDHLRPFVENISGRPFICSDNEGNEIVTTADFSSWLEPESPWSIMARIFLAGKHYE